jgi:two-component system chemotaxis sensor kinase CheA
MRQISARAAQHARELDFVGQILDAGVGEFVRFCAKARELMLEARRQLQGGAPEASAAARGRIFRNLHTLKGNARLLGLSHFANVVHLAEESFDVRQRQPITLVGQALAIDAVLDGISEYEQVYERKLGDVLPEPERKRDQLWSAIGARVNEAQSGSIGPREALLAIGELLRRGGARPLGQIVKSALRLLPALALELGKVAPLCEVEDRGIWLTEAWAQALEDSLVHIFQNAMDHGIENAEERALAQKPSQGKLTVRAATTTQGVTIRCFDDGRGLNLGVLRRAHGTPDETDEQTAVRVFGVGISTAERVGSVSGRGVGLDAVRAVMRELGGEVSISFTGPDVAGHRPFELLFELPAEALLADAKRPSRPPSTPPGRAALRAHAAGK